MKILLIMFAFMFLISSCSSEVIDEKNPNTLEHSAECASLCEVNQEFYCVDERELIFEDGSNTFGSCRAFSKYNSEFDKCQGYCTDYGKGPKCRLEDGSVDDNCDGQ